MRADHVLQPFRSLHVYGFAEEVYANVLGKGDFDDETFPDLFDEPRKAAYPHKDTLLHEGMSRSLLKS